MVTSPSMRLASSKSTKPTFWPASSFSIRIALNFATSLSLGLRGGGDWAHHRPLDDGQVDERRQEAERHRQPPYQIVGAGALEHDAAEPDADEAADLVAEEGEAEQHGEPAGAEHHRDQTRGRRHSGKPCEAGDDGEEERGQVRYRHRDEGDDRQRADEIDYRQDVALGHAVTEPAGDERAHDVEQADGGERPAAGLCRQAAVEQVRRQVRGDEGQLEAAGEETEYEQDVAAMPERFR